MQDVLVEEYRGGLLDNLIRGRIAVMGESGLVARFGDVARVTFYRSASKPMQALPVLMRGLDRQYGFTEAETTIMAGSHDGEPFHVEAILSMLDKAGFSEDDLIVPPSYPGSQAARDAFIREGKPPRKACHNCAGKHVGLLLLSRALGEPAGRYWQVDSAAQKEILRVLSVLTAVPQEQIGIGVDGCGVPVYAVPLTAIARSELCMAAPDLVEDRDIREAIERFTPLIHRHNRMMRGTGLLCSVINEDPNIVAKGGAKGVYGFGLKKQRLGVALKMEDGSEEYWALVLQAILRQLGYENQETLDKLERLSGRIVTNCLLKPVGEAKPVFQLARV